MFDIFDRKIRYFLYLREGNGKNAFWRFIRFFDLAPIKTLGPYPGKMIDRLAKADDSNFCGF